MKPLQKLASIAAASFGVVLADVLLNRASTYSSPRTPVTPAPYYVDKKMLQQEIRLAAKSATADALSEFFVNPMHNSSIATISSTKKDAFKVALQNKIDTLRRVDGYTYANYAAQLLQSLLDLFSCYDSTIAENLQNTYVNRITTLNTAISDYVSRKNSDTPYGFPTQLVGSPLVEDLYSLAAELDVLYNQL